MLALNKSHCLVLIVALLFIAAVSYMTMQSGAIAFAHAEQIYASGKYDQAVTMLQDLAAKGNAQAADRLALIYEYGAGVPADPHKAFQLFSDFAAKGDTTAMARLGRMYQYGWTVAPDIPKAIELYRRSSDSDDDEGTAYLALAYRDGVGVPKDTDKAISLLDSAANREGRASLFLGDCYQHGCGVTLDPHKAQQLYEQAAKLGNKGALDALGKMYRDGIGVKWNDRRAVDLFEQARDQWVPDGAYDLAYMYRDGRGTGRSHKLFLQSLQRSADQGYPAAEHDLAHLYENGDGVPQDRRKALDLFEQAARFGWADPANDAANILEYHPIDGKRDYNEAFKWRLKAAEQGLALAQNAVASAYRNGRGVTADAQESARWSAKATAYFRTQALAGDSSCEYRLGEAYENGLGIPIDKLEARRWYEKAAAHGHPHACNQLANLLWNLPPLDKNRVLAAELYKKGAQNGCPFAQLNLARRYDTGSPEIALNVPQAIYWYRKAADQDVEDASYLLAQHYERGDGVPKNIPTAIHYYQMAEADTNQTTAAASTKAVASLKRELEHQSKN